MTARYYRELVVWKKAMELAVASYGLAQRLPPSERSGLVPQIRRAAASIPANIAEGNGRSTSGAYLQHLRIARGSLMELETHLELSRRLGLVMSEDVAAAMRLADETSRLLTALMRALAR